MHHSIIAIGAFAALCVGSIVPREESISGLTFNCPSDFSNHLCCVESVSSDGSVRKCQEGTLSHNKKSDEVVFSLRALNRCSLEQQTQGFANGVCCRSQSQVSSEDSTLHGTDCVAGSLVAATRRNAASARTVKRSRDELPNALKLLGLPSPKQLRSRSQPETGNTKRKDTGKASPDTKARSNSAPLPAAQADSPQLAPLRRSASESRNAGYTYRDANRMLGLPKARAAAAARDAKKVVKRSDDTATGAGASSPPSPAARVGLPVKQTEDVKTGAQADDSLNMPRHSSRVDRAIRKLEERKVPVKAPRWSPSTAFMFIG